MTDRTIHLNENLTGLLDTLEERGYNVNLLIQQALISHFKLNPHLGRLHFPEVLPGQRKCDYCDIGFSPNYQWHKIKDEWICIDCYHNRENRKRIIESIKDGEFRRVNALTQT